MRAIVAVLVLGTFAVTASAAQAADTNCRRLAPPPRPIPVTVAQFDALDELSHQPEHAAVAAKRASYSPEAARTMTDIGAAAFQIGFPGAILAVLIAAMPL